MQNQDNNHDESLERLLRQVLSEDKPSPQLREKLYRIPDQFPHPTVTKHAQPAAKNRRWLLPALATAASVMGIMTGLLGVMGGLPEQNLLASLLYGTPDLMGISL